MLGLGSASWNDLGYFSILCNRELLGYASPQKTGLLDPRGQWLGPDSFSASTECSSVLISIRWQSAYFTSSWLTSSVIHPARENTAVAESSSQGVLLGMLAKGNAGQPLYFRIQETKRTLMGLNVLWLLLFHLSI